MFKRSRIELKDHNGHGPAVHALEEELNPISSIPLSDTTIYKVYKRRWIGVVIIMLLNIVSAWRYSFWSLLFWRGSWIAFAPVATLTQQFFGLSSTTPVNWLSTVVLFIYCIMSPVSAYIFHNHGIRPGVLSLDLTLIAACIGSNFHSNRKLVEICWSTSEFDSILVGNAWPDYYWSRATLFP